jgi:hypothetical protein
MRTHSTHTRLFSTALVALALLGVTACQGSDALPRNPGPSAESEEPFLPQAFTPLATAGGVSNTFHHPQSIDNVRTADAREVLERMEEEGPPAYRARVHGCRKMRYATVGRVLRGIGVDTAADDGAGPMYRSADQALGAPNYAARIPETTELTTASASRLFDLLVAAAPEIIENVESAERCQIGGRGVQIFDESGACTEEGLTCLLGEPARAEHVALCDQMVERSSSPETGRVVAVASVLAAASTCE